MLQSGSYAMYIQMLAEKGLNTKMEERAKSGTRAAIWVPHVHGQSRHALSS